jgi:hypothetical protein
MTTWDIPFFCVVYVCVFGFTTVVARRTKYPILLLIAQGAFLNCVLLTVTASATWLCALSYVSQSVDSEVIGAFRAPQTVHCKLDREMEIYQVRPSLRVKQATEITRVSLRSRGRVQFCLVRGRAWGKGKSHRGSLHSRHRN